MDCDWLLLACHQLVVVNATLPHYSDVLCSPEGECKSVTPHTNILVYVCISETMSHKHVWLICVHDKRAMREMGGDQRWTLKTVAQQRGWDCGVVIWWQGSCLLLLAVKISFTLPRLLCVHVASPLRSYYCYIL